ncbi:hypothetical protein JST97_29760 [bacterium]|nr:hypothetical protein [bacterium]
MALPATGTRRPLPQPGPGPIGSGGGNPMQIILQIITQLMQVMMSQFQGGGFQQPSNPFGNPGAYGPQQPSPFNFYAGGGAGGGGYLI